MALEFPTNLDLDKDTQEILKVFLNDDDLLKLLTIAPTSSSHNVLLEPSIVNVKTLQQRFSEYYLGTQPNFVNWGRWLKEDVEEKGRILFYPAPIGLQNTIDKTNFIFDCLVPLTWHTKTNVAYKVMRRVVALLKDTRTFGDSGKVKFLPATAILTVPDYAGYHIVATNYNFVS